MIKSFNIHAIIASTALVLAISAPLQAQELDTRTTTQLEAQVPFDVQYVTDYAGKLAAEMVTELQDAGYQVTDMSRTFLGRTKITVQNEINARVIVLSRRTGEVKRDSIIEPNVQQSSERSSENRASINVQSQTNIEPNVQQPSERRSQNRASTNVQSQTRIGSSVSGNDGNTGVSVGSSTGASVSIGLGN